MCVEPVAEFVGHHALDEGLRLGIAEFGLGLAFELRVGEFDGYDGGQTFAHVITGKVVVLFFEDVLLARIPVDERGERRAEAFLVGAAFGCGDGVGEGVHRFGVGGRPLHGDFRRNADVEVFGLEIDDFLFNRVGFAAFDQIGHVILDAVLVAVRHGAMELLDRVVAVAGHLVARLVDFTQVGQGDAQAAVQEGHLLETRTQGFEIVDRGFEDLRVGPEGHGGACRFAVLHGLALGERRRRMLVDVRLGPMEALTTHLDLHTRGQRVDHGDAHAMQTAGDRIAAAAELAARVQLGHNRLNAGNTFARHNVNRDAASVVHHADAVVRQNGHFDMGGETGQGLVH